MKVSIALVELLSLSLASRNVLVGQWFFNTVDSIAFLSITKEVLYWDLPAGWVKSPCSTFTCAPVLSHGGTSWLHRLLQAPSKLLK